MGLYFAEPPRTRLAVEDQAAITSVELRSLIGAAEDLGYGERSFEYEIQPSVAQDRIIRAATSRYLREKFPALHAHESGAFVRTLANRGDQGLVCLVSVMASDVAFVVKVSPDRDAREEARRFTGFAHGAGLDMTFYCHGRQAALVLAPIGGARFGSASSLEGELALRDRLADVSTALETCGPLIDSAIAALERFTRLVRPEGVTTHCWDDDEETEAQLGRLGALVVAGERIDLRWLHAWGREALTRSWGHAVVHGDAHPGNILFAANGSAVLIDYECAGLGPACHDLCTLWIHVLATRFVALSDERDTVGLFRDLLAGVPFVDLTARWHAGLRLAVNTQAVYLASRAIEASVAVMEARGLSRADVHGVVAAISCRELFNPGFQQHALRSVLAATQAVLRAAAAG
jgi:Ser/Thr protein kinase RdoA (MazF antagonist)